MRQLSDEQIQTYHRDGYLHLPAWFESDELRPIQALLRQDPTAGGRISHVHDGAEETRGEDANGYRLDYMGWFTDGDDWLGTCTRLQCIVEGAAKLIGEPVYHYHSKLVKKPKIGSGSLIWHQDYGGWYQDGCLMPDMLTCVVAVTDATDASGCLRFLKGSHKLGRVDRIRSEHAYANIHPRRLESMLATFEQIPAEMRAGDALFFHGNLVHSSGPNSADYDRWLLEFSYNGVSNAPVFEDQSHHAVKPMHIAPDDALRAGQFVGVFDATSIQDVTDPNAQGASIYFRDNFPDLS